LLAKDRNPETAPATGYVDLLIDPNNPSNHYIGVNLDRRNNEKKEENV